MLAGDIVPVGHAGITCTKKHSGDALSVNSTLGGQHETLVLAAGRSRAKKVHAHRVGCCT